MNINRVTKYKTSVALSVLLALGACDSTDGDFEDINITISQTDAVEQQSVAVTLDASQEIPTPVGVPANASGIADVAVDENGVVTATLTVSNLTGPATAAHIHSGFAGETGPVLVGLTTDDGGTTWTVPADAATLTAEQIEAFNNGGLYFNVHTEANAPGEIRGQINAAAAIVETPIISVCLLYTSPSPRDRG